MLRVHEEGNRGEKASPPGDPIPINVESFATDYLEPDDAVIREVVVGLCNSRSGSSGGIKAGHIKVWLWSIREEEEGNKEEAGNLR